MAKVVKMREMIMMDPDTDDVGEGWDDEATEDEVVELENEVGEEDEVVTENSGPDEGENGGGDDGAGDDGGDYNFHDEDEEEFGNGGDGEDYPDHEDSFDFGQFKPEAGSDYFEEYDTTE